MSITITLEDGNLRSKCPNCEYLFDSNDVTLEPVYECGSCGNIDEERRCSDCNLFKAKADGGVCPECAEYVERLDDVYVITCVCCDEEHEVYT